MKKIFTLLFISLNISAFAGSTVYNFGSTTGSITADQLTVSGFTAATAADSMLVNYDYTTAASEATLSISSIPNVVISYTNSSTKSGFLRIYPYALYTNGKNVYVTMSNVNIGDSIIFATQSKGSTADVWSVTSGAETSSSLNIPAAVTPNPVSYIRLKATDATVKLRETGGGFRLLSITWIPYVNTSGVTTTLAEEGIVFNGSEIVNTNNKSIQVYNVLGKLIATSNGNISTTNFAKGVYVVRAQGVSSALKFSK